MPGVRRVGDWIGDRFEVFDVHEGGMSIVYVAYDHLGKSGRTVVALKTLKDELLRYRIRLSRFATECRLWVQLGKHPNIVQAYSVEIMEGKPFAVLELVQGGDLVRWIGSRRLDLAQALRFGVQFCQGMEHAARQGMSCHRDIKPANLLITENGVLKITDFGLARICEEMVAVRPELPDGSIPLADSPRTSPRIVVTDAKDQPVRPLSLVDPEPARTTRLDAVNSGRKIPPRHSSPSDFTIPLVGDDSVAPGSTGLVAVAEPIPLPIDEETSDGLSTRQKTGRSRLTRSGARLGTGAYMAPEQFRDPGSVDVGADIYSFGVVLFEMIAGKPPFLGDSPDMLSRQHSLYAPPSVVPLIPRVSSRVASQVDQVVQRCLKKNPLDRFGTMSELRRSLLTLLARLGTK